MVSVRMEHVYPSSVMETGQFKEKLCLEVCLLVSYYSRNGHYPSYFRSYDCLSDFLETRKLVSCKIRKKEVGHLSQPPFEYDIIS